MRIGLLADVHGNRWALDAVLDHASRRAIDRWADLGDTVYGPLDPSGTAQRLRALRAVTVRGNQDRLLVEPPDDAERIPNFAFVRDALSDDDHAWLASLPVTAEVGTGASTIFLCHGTPRDDQEPLVEAVGEYGVALRDGSDIESLLPGVTAPVVGCGHTHVARQVRLPRGTLVVNPGSVGLPAYTHDEPHPHAMEAGSPHARYAVLEEVISEGAVAGWTVEQHAVPYDWEAAAREAERNGRPDWAVWLRTGRAA